VLKQYQQLDCGKADAAAAADSSENDLEGVQVAQQNKEKMIGKR
jgi:hypothetical protein